jgi:hypothetical protein
MKRTLRHVARAGAAIAVVALLCGPGTSGAVTYEAGKSPAAAPSIFDFGRHLPNWVGPSVEEGNGTLLDGTRVYLNDVNGAAENAQTATPFQLLVWQFSSPRDSVRLYTHQDHDFGGPIGGNAPEVLEYSVWGCLSSPGNDCTAQADWHFLSDPNGFSIVDDLPFYTFAGIAPTTIWRGGSTEFGITNAYVQDFTFPTAYDYYAIRGSTIAMQAFTADPELDAMASFRRVDFPGPGTAPEPGTLLLVAAAVAGATVRRRPRR